MIDIKHFMKKFGNKTVHKDINLEIKSGECLALIGGSGVGKSVLLRSLIGLEKPDSGEIFIDGVDIVPMEEDDLVEIRKKVAYVFQNGALFDSMSVYDNLAYPLREHTTLSDSKIREKIMELLEEFGLKGSHLLSPSELSGGMQKRVGLARAIILDPAVVLYDEPTAGLDPYNTIKIQEMILRMKKKGTTSVFVTHDMPSVFSVCDRIAYIQNGVVQNVKATSEVLKDQNDPIQNFMQGKVS